MSNNPKTDREQKVFKDEYDQTVECPWCKSTDTEVASPFGGTVSEILFKCNGCNYFNTYDSLYGKTAFRASSVHKE